MVTYVPTYNITAARNFDGRLEVFAYRQTGGFSHTWQTSPGGRWETWWPLDTRSIYQTSHVVSNSDGRLEVFVLSGRQLYHIWQTSPGGRWETWWPLGGGPLPEHPEVRPYAIRNSDGRLQVFVWKGDEPFYVSQLSPGGDWSGWRSLGPAIIANPVASINKDGRLEVFVAGTDNAMWHKWQTSPGSRTWSNPWNSRGGIVDSRDNLIAIQNSDGRLEVFASRPGNSLWHTWQTSPGGRWETWWPLGGGGVSVIIPSVARNSDGRLEVFAVKPGDVPAGVPATLWHIWQNYAGGTWSEWRPLPQGTESVSVVRFTVAVNSDGRLEVFATQRHNSHWHNWQTTPAGDWSGWYPL